MKKQLQTLYEQNMSQLAEFGDIKGINKSLGIELQERIVMQLGLIVPVMIRTELGVLPCSSL
ncbi:unnamed protein product [Eruca vesicaria subsp. sativa]|uniref:Uncharacterized protein n=1 Tax=Eruca vesicaria subsp. sativa TaxID=29727 RepID=A0ABC8LPX1_ERUVS|nr:unnamed protein product [Eruca vesicaria subsp. sativa]